MEADKLLPDVNHLVLCTITAKDKFRKSTRYEELKRKLRVLLVTLRQSRMTKFAQAYLRRLKEMFERKTAARQLVVPAMQAVAHGGMHAGIFFGINFYRVICVSGNFHDVFFFRQRFSLFRHRMRFFATSNFLPSFSQ